VRVVGGQHNQRVVGVGQRDGTLDGIVERDHLLQRVLGATVVMTVVYTSAYTHTHTLLPRGGSSQVRWVKIHHVNY